MGEGIETGAGQVTSSVLSSLTWTLPAGVKAGAREETASQTHDDANVSGTGKSLGEDWTPEKPSMPFPRLYVPYDGGFDGIATTSQKLSSPTPKGSGVKQYHQLASISGVVFDLMD